MENHTTNHTIINKESVTDVLSQLMKTITEKIDNKKDVVDKIFIQNALLEAIKDVEEKIDPTALLNVESGTKWKWALSRIHTMLSENYKSTEGKTYYLIDTDTLVKGILECKNSSPENSLSSLPEWPETETKLKKGLLKFINDAEEMGTAIKSTADTMTMAVLVMAVMFVVMLIGLWLSSSKSKTETAYKKT